MSNYRIQYLRDRSNRPVGCVAIKLGTPDLSGGVSASYQVSVANPLDNFDKKLARQLTIGRLIESPRTVHLPSMPNMHEVTKAVMRSIKRDHDAPTRARVAAHRWLRQPIVLAD